MLVHCSLAFKLQFITTNLFYGTPMRRLPGRSQKEFVLCGDGVRRRVFFVKHVNPGLDYPDSKCSVISYYRVCVVAFFFQLSFVPRPVLSWRVQRQGLQFTRGHR